MTEKGAHNPQLSRLIPSGPRPKPAPKAKPYWVICRPRVSGGLAEVTHNCVAKWSRQSPAPTNSSSPLHTGGPSKNGNNTAQQAMINKPVKITLRYPARRRIGPTTGTINSIPRYKAAALSPLMLELTPFCSRRVVNSGINRPWVIPVRAMMTSRIRKRICDH